MLFGNRPQCSTGKPCDSTGSGMVHFEELLTEAHWSKFELANQISGLHFSLKRRGITEF